MDTASKQNVLQQAEEQNVKFIRLWFTDILGTLKSFAITIDELEDALDGGMGFDGSSITGYQDIEESDMIAMPDPSTFKAIPWSPKEAPTARMICDVRTPDGDPYVGDPRHVLRRALERASDGGHVLTLAGPGERSRQVRARYVIGADGVRSGVREALGIATSGAPEVPHGFGMLFRAPLWELVGEHRYGIYFITEEPENRAFIPAGKGDRWMFAMPWDAADGESPSPEDLKRSIREAAGDPGLPIELGRSMPVAFATALAERFRAGDAFLIGDAAHRVTPRGGTGLNTAIRDGFDIGWKLAWVLRGWGGERLLDSYERERRPVAEFNTQRSMRDDGSILGTAVGLGVDIGGRIAHVWVARGGGLVSTLDLLGEGLTLLVGPDWDGSVPRE